MRLFSTHKPDVVPNEEASLNELKNFSERIKIILQVSSEDEFQAAITLLRPPSSSFKKVVTFPSDGIYYFGILAMTKVALVYPGASDANAHDHVQSPLERFPSAECIIETGSCRAFDEKIQRPGDVLISETISTSENTQIAIDESLNKEFCEPFETIGYDCLVSKPERKSKVYCGMLDSFAITPKSLMDKTGCELLKLKSRKVIVIKGVASYGDEITEEIWQFTATRAAVQYTRQALFYKGRNVYEGDYC